MVLIAFDYISCVMIVLFPIWTEMADTVPEFPGRPGLCCAVIELDERFRRPG